MQIVRIKILGLTGPQRRGDLGTVSVVFWVFRFPRLPAWATGRFSVRICGASSVTLGRSPNARMGGCLDLNPHLRNPHGNPIVLPTHNWHGNGGLGRYYWLSEIMGQKPSRNCTITEAVTRREGATAEGCRPRCVSNGPFGSKYYSSPSSASGQN